MRRGEEARVRGKIIGSSERRPEAVHGARCAVHGAWEPRRGVHSCTLELNLSTYGKHSWFKLGCMGHKDSSS
jgi:hypothetical protein